MKETSHHTHYASLEDLFQSARRKLLRMSEELGHGAFAYTYSHPTDRRLVVKLGRYTPENWAWGNPGAAAERDGCLVYLRSLRSFGPSVFFPRVASIDVWINPERRDAGAMYLITMERLVDWEETGVSNKEFGRMIHRRFGSVPDVSYRHQEVLDDPKADPQSKALAECLQTLYLTNGNDLHNRNWLARKHGDRWVPVITDPAT